METMELSENAGNVEMPASPASPAKNSSSEDELGLDDPLQHTPLKKRPDWKDCKPIPLTELNSKVCKIPVTSSVEETYTYFRAVVHSNELSRRAFSLTKEVISKQPADYTAWAYRRKILQDESVCPFPDTWKEELVFLNSIAVDLEKIY